MLLRTLGTLSLEGTALTRPKPLLVLAYLALEGATTRGALAELFFASAADPRDSLATALRHLRRAGALVEDGPERCRVAPALGCDVAALLAAFDMARYDEVVRAYTGTFLEGADRGLDEEAETWVFETREAVAARVRTAQLQLAGRALSETRLDDARALLREAVRVRGAPEFEADELRTALAVADRLGAPEAAQLRALAAGYGVSLATAATERGAAGAGQLATLHRATRFVGRRAELDRLEQLVRSGAQLVSLVGLGGVGKTRLAVRFAEVAELDATRFPAGVWRVGFDGVEADVDVARHVARHLDLTSERVNVDAVCRWLERRAGLLLLDNLEHVHEAAAFVEDVARRCPDVVTLVTTRVRLGVESEHVVDLDGLALAAGPTQRSDAAALFVERALRVGYDLDAAERDREEIEALCRALGGYPLGIELAAAWTRLLSVLEIAATFQGGLELLDDGPVDAPARHRAVAATLGPSLAWLEPRELRVLQALAVFAGSFAFDAAVAVAQASLPVMARLVDQALVRSTGGGRGRFVLHPVLREFVREHTPDAVRGAAVAAHVRFYAGLLERSRDALLDAPATVLERLELDLGDIVAALRTALELEPERGVAMAAALVVDADVLQARPSSTELVSLAERSAVVAEDLGQVDAARALLVKLANAHRVLRGDDVRSIATYRRALELAERSGDVPALVMLHAILGTAVHASDREAALAHLDEAERLAGDEPLLVCEVLQRRGFVATRTDDWDAVRAINERAVELTTRLLEVGHPDVRRVVSLHYFCLHNLGGALDYAGEYEASIAVRQRALAFAEARGQRLWAAFARHEIASGLVDWGRRDEAVPYARVAHRELRAMGAVADLELLERQAREWGIDLDEQRPGGVGPP